jgi:hypothetical protein
MRNKPPKSVYRRIAAGVPGQRMGSNPRPGLEGRYGEGSKVGWVDGSQIGGLAAIASLRSA